MSATSDCLPVPTKHGTEGTVGNSPADTEKDAANSRNPQHVLDFIGSRPDGYFKGKDILLSTGRVSRIAPGQIGLVPQEIDVLKKAGARSVTVLGLGARPDLAALNNNLLTMANDGGAAFAGPLKGTEKDSAQVHPVGSYPQMVQQATQAYNTYKQSTPAQGAPTGQTGAPTGPAPGLLEPGNIDLANRPVVKNADNSISTVRSMSFEENGKEVLIPTVAADGSGILSDKDAIEQYHKTGQFLGKFDNADNADAYAQKLHESQAQAYSGGGAPDQLAGDAQKPPVSQQSPGLAAMPSKEAMINAIPRGLSPEAYQAAVSRIDQAYSQQLARTYEERRKMDRWLTGGLTQLSDGKDFQYDPNVIRHYLTPDEADKALDALDTAQQKMGVWKTQIQTMTPQQIQDASVKLHHDLDSSLNSDQYPRQKKILESFDAAVKSQNEQLLGPNADPAGYLRRIDPASMPSGRRSIGTTPIASTPMRPRWESPARSDGYSEGSAAYRFHSGSPKA